MDCTGTPLLKFTLDLFYLHLITGCVLIQIDSFQPPGNIGYASLVIGGSFIIEGINIKLIILEVDS